MKNTGYRSLLKKLQYTSLFILLMLSAYSGADDRLTIFTEQSYPLSYTKSGKDADDVIGYGARLVRAVMREADLEYDMTIVPWKRALHALQGQSGVMVFPMTRTKEREDRYIWLGMVTEVKYSLFGLSDRIDSLPKVLMEAKDLNVGVIRGDVVEQYLEGIGFNNLVQVNTSGRNLIMAQRGRIDLFPYAKFGFEVFASKNGFDSNDYTAIIPLLEISTGMHMVIGLGADKALVRRVKNAYARVKESGEFDRIMNSTLEND